jgi:hypothetical protein
VKATSYAMFHRSAAAAKKVAVGGVDFGSGRGSKQNSSQRPWKGSGAGRGVGGRGRGNQSGGRSNGGGRGFNNNSNRGVQIVTSDFVANMHIPSGAAEYKVHAPLCDCKAMQAVRNRIPQRIRREDDKDSMIRTGTGSSKEDTPGVSSLEIRLLAQQQTQAGPADADADESSLLNGLVVLPKIKNVAHVYVCRDQTDSKSFKVDPLAAERRLRDQLYPSNHSSELPKSEPHELSREKFKLSGASCMLQHAPNGFVCVYSSVSSSFVDAARDTARRAREAKLTLHSDHAHFVCTLPRAALWKLQTARSRSQVHQATHALAHCLSQQGCTHRDDPVSDGEPTTTKNKNEPSVSIEFGHHLKSLLNLRAGPKNDNHQEYWLTLVYDDTKPHSSNVKWSLDLPGGKRHLGESSLDGAIRETNEECSLEFNESWVVGPPVSGKKDKSNVYFMLQPPTQNVIEDVTSNPFWSNAGL